MKRTTISLPDAVKSLLQREARRRGESVSEVTRQAWIAYLRNGEPRQVPFAALGASGYTDTAKNIEEILAEEWGGAGSRCATSPSEHAELTVATSESTAEPQVRELSPEEARAWFDEQARALLGISGAEFVRRLDAGDYEQIIDDPGEHPYLMWLATLRSFHDG